MGLCTWSGSLHIKITTKENQDHKTKQGIKQASCTSNGLIYIQDKDCNMYEMNIMGASSPVN